MRELSVCQALVRLLEGLAQEHSASRVCRVTVRIGVLSGVEAEALHRAYPIASAGTRAEGSTLQIENMPARVECPSCGTESHVESSRLVCGLCGNWRTRLISGGELVLVSADLEVPDRGTPICATPVAVISPTATGT